MVGLLVEAVESVIGLPVSADYEIVEEIPLTFTVTPSMTVAYLGTDPDEWNERTRLRTKPHRPSPRCRNRIEPWPIPTFDTLKSSVARDRHP